jgi:hypothetical protein
VSATEGPTALLIARNLPRFVEELLPAAQRDTLAGIYLQGF